MNRRSLWLRVAANACETGARPHGIAEAPVLPVYTAWATVLMKAADAMGLQLVKARPKRRRRREPADPLAAERAEARRRWHRITPYRLGLVVGRSEGSSGASRCPYVGSAAVSFRAGVEDGAKFCEGEA